MNNPTEQSMKRARVLVRDGFGESGQWQGIATDIAAALDEAHDEGVVSAIDGVAMAEAMRVAEAKGYHDGVAVGREEGRREGITESAHWLRERMRWTGDGWEWAPSKEDYRESPETLLLNRAKP